MSNNPSLLDDLPTPEDMTTMEATISRFLDPDTSLSYTTLNIRPALVIMAPNIRTPIQLTCPLCHSATTTIPKRRCGCCQILKCEIVTYLIFLVIACPLMYGIVAVMAAILPYYDNILVRTVHYLLRCVALFLIIIIIVGPFVICCPCLFSSGNAEIDDNLTEHGCSECRELIGISHVTN